jgi:hypothetical protein
VPRPWVVGGASGVDMEGRRSRKRTRRSLRPSGTGGGDMRSTNTGVACSCDRGPFLSTNWYDLFYETKLA